MPNRRSTSKGQIGSTRDFAIPFVVDTEQLKHGLIDAKRVWEALPVMQGESLLQYSERAKKHRASIYGKENA